MHFPQHKNYSYFRQPENNPLFTTPSKAPGETGSGLKIYSNPITEKLSSFVGSETVTVSTYIIGFLLFFLKSLT